MIPNDNHGRNIPIQAELEREFELLLDRITDCIEAGESVDLEIVAAEHPAFAERIRKLLPTITALAGLKSQDSETCQHFRPDAVERADWKTLGDYRIVREIGRGGMGVVYEAEQISLRRRIALKVLPFAGAVDARNLQRFKNEAMAAARLDHPNIVDVHGVGSDRGVHYYAMRYIEGHTLADWIQEARAAREFEVDGFAQAPRATHQNSPRFEDVDVNSPTVAFNQNDLCEAASPPELEHETAPVASLSTYVRSDSKRGFHRVARIGAQVADALQYAHENGIVHRDIKPSNLLVDSDGKVWITDFGLAHIETEPALTRSDDVLGTIRYMSPEQASGRDGVVDHRADVYSLGVTLYELLALRTPFACANRASMLKQLTHEEPKYVRKLNEAVPVDLETIVMKAIARLPEERYPTARALADDLRRFMEDRPILARRSGALVKAGKWMRRHPAIIGTASVVALFALVGLIVSNVLIANAFDVAETRRRETVAQRDAAKDILYVAHMRLAAQDWKAGQIDRMKATLEAHVPTDNEVDRRGWEWRYLDHLNRQHAGSFEGHTGKVRALDASPDGKQLASGAEDFSVRLWDVASRREVARFNKHRSHVFGVAWAPDGRRLASGDEAGRIFVWNTETGRIIRQFDYGSHIYGVAWSPDGERLCAGNSDGRLRIWNVESGEAIHDLDGDVGMIRSVSWSPDGKRIAAGENFRGNLQVWDAETGALLKSWRAHGHVVQAIAWSPDGTRLASGSFDQSLQIWDGETYDHLLSIDPAHSGQIYSLAWGPDGRRIASGAADGVAKIWNAESGALHSERRGHAGPIEAVAWSPRTKRLFTASWDETIKVWDADAPQEFTIVNGRNRFAWTPDGHSLAIGGPLRDDGSWDSVQIVDMKSGEVVSEWANAFKRGAGLFSLDWDRRGARLAAARGNGKVIVWDALQRKVLWSVQADKRGEARAAAWSPDGNRLTTGGFDQRVKIWSGDKGEHVCTLEGHPAPIGSVAWSPDGRQIASADWRQNVKLWDADTGRERLSLRLHPYKTFGATGQNSVAWSPDGERLAAGSAEGLVLVWDAKSGRELASLKGHTSNVRSIAWSPDGARLASGSLDWTVRVWDPTTGEELLVLDAGQKISSVGWSPDGIHLTASGEEHVRIWSASPRNQD